MKKILASAAAVVLLSAASASAVSITITDYTGKASYDAITAGFAGKLVEDFEGFREGNVANGFPTAVGTFRTLGGTGSGTTVTNPDPGFPHGNNGSQLAIRDGNVHGRESTSDEIFGKTPGDKFLDSNDTWGIKWIASAGGRVFDQLVFVMTDATDVGRTLTVFAKNGALTDTEVIPGRSFPDGSKKLVHIVFGEYISEATIKLNYSRQTNDGVGMDDITLAAVPLPAPALMLLAGLAGLAAMRRKRAAA